jgi:hypothetical protein
MLVAKNVIRRNIQQTGHIVAKNSEETKFLIYQLTTYILQNIEVCKLYFFIINGEFSHFSTHALRECHFIGQHQTQPPVSLWNSS